MELNLKLYIICFMDSLALGLFLPILSSHITALGGTHTTLGVLASLYAAVRLFASSLTRTWCDAIGKKPALLLILVINYIVYLPFGSTKSYLIVILLRLLIGLTSQTQNVCNSFMTEFNPKESLQSVSSIINILSVAGLVIGPTIGGAIYEEVDGFYYICRLAGTFLCIAIVVCITLPHSTTVSGEVKNNCLKRAIGDLQKKFSKFGMLKIRDEWDIVTVKFLHSITSTVFFMKFSMLLKVHYLLPSALVGLTYAYQGSLTFLAPFCTVFIETPKFNSAKTIGTLFLATLGCLGLCFGKTYDTYLISFVPMVLSHTLLNGAWKKAFTERSSEDYDIEGLQDGIGDIASIVIPAIFGIFCDLYGVQALQSYVMIPMLLNIFIAIVVIRPQTPKKKVMPKSD